MCAIFTLNVQDVVSRNFTLEVGGTSETVQVNGSGINMNTTDGSVKHRGRRPVRGKHAAERPQFSIAPRAYAGYVSQFYFVQLLRIVENGLITAP